MRQNKFMKNVIINVRRFNKLKTEYGQLLMYFLEHNGEQMTIKDIAEDTGLFQWWVKQHIKTMKAHKLIRTPKSDDGIIILVTTNMAKLL